MNTIIKTAVVAASLAFGGVASAAAIPTEGLFFSAFDGTNGTSIVVNLGTTTTAFRSSPTTPYTLSGDGLAGLQTWLSTADRAAVTWNVVGAADDGSGAVLAPTENYGGLATSTDIETVFPGWGQFTGIDATLGNFVTFRGVVNGGLASSNSYAPPSSPDAYFFISQGGGAGFNSVAGVGTAMPFYAFFADAIEPFATGDFAALGGEWLLDYANGTASLAYSSDVNPIPLPAAAWLLLSGLVGLAGVARRKTAA